MRRRCYSGAEVVVNVSASPFRAGIDATRREMLATRSADNQAVLAYANRAKTGAFRSIGVALSGGRDSLLSLLVAWRAVQLRRGVPKTVVVALLERLHRRYGFAGIAATLDTAPGPELAAAQRAEEELMPFPVLDACLHLFAAEKLAPGEVAAALASLFPDLPAERLASWARRFAQLFTRSIYKWVQSPLALHVGSLDLDRERALQLPVVQSGEWQEND